MNTQKTLFLFTTLLLAIVYCMSLYELRTAGIVLVLVCMGLPVLVKYTMEYTDVVLGLIIATIGLCPFFVNVGIGPGTLRLYGEDIPTLYYAVYMVIAYGLLRRKPLHTGNIWLLLAFVLFVMSASIPFFTNPIAKNALRNFAETFILGFALYLIFYNETTDDNVDLFTAFIAWTTATLSVVVLLEVIFQANPLMLKAKEVMDGFMYILPSRYTAIGSYYRPYAVFFHPSEAGTFLAMGFPFVQAYLRDKSPLLKYPLLALVLLGVVLNYTRGVWLALAVAWTVCNFSRVRRVLPVMAVVFGVCLLGFLLVYGNTPFGKRILDPTNLYNRLYYWQVGLAMTGDNFPFGIGHMNFEHRYLEYVDTAPVPQGLDVQQIFVADNMLLTSLVEQGVLGFATLCCFLGTVYYQFAKRIRLLRKQGHERTARRCNVLLQAALVYLFAGMFADVHLFSKVTKLFFISIGMAFALMSLRASEDAQAPAKEASGEIPALDAAK
ncbi:O-antigen ligase family protein [Fundidesulfovibrio agrisoli]|uniref:O-antigen ligase family protein n=1 Tax=Fundidesulfovibrio agrisoli TaxID=2922717 RepID=UPI001FADBA5C|nr:O-antigen ligase family protein [Fundidesulfovibrio agrisoli]